MRASEDAWRDRPRPKQPYLSSHARRGLGDRVELAVNGTWGTVCQAAVEDEEGEAAAFAQVVCRHLGFDETLHPVTASYLPASSTPNGNSDLAISVVTPRRCTGSEDSIWSCAEDGSGASPSCSHLHDVGVHCNYSVAFRADLPLQSEPRGTWALTEEQDGNGGELAYLLTGEETGTIGTRIALHPCPAKGCWSDSLSLFPVLCVRGVCGWLGWLYHHL